MLCPFCHHSDTKVVDKRDNSENNLTRRRRECESCGKRFTTYERIENIDLYVRKKSGKLEEFNRDKIKHGVMIALVNREISERQVDDLVNQVELHLLSLGKNEVESKVVGETVLSKLQELDPLGYLRFASVYNAFTNISDFKAAISKLEENV
jgi:transcriptional repressor NrdR